MGELSADRPQGDRGMTLRDNLTPEQAWAHAVLDDVRAALRVLGDMA